MPEQFDDAASALRYAFAERNGYGRPAVSRMADPTRGEGLTPIEQCAMAGMILADVRKLGPVAEHVLSARYARRMLVCMCQSHCCSGRRPNEDWAFSIAYLAEVIRTGVLYGRNTTVAQRNALLELAFGASKRTLVDVAKAHNLHRDTVATWSRLVGKWLLQAERKAYDEFESAARGNGWLKG